VSAVEEAAILREAGLDDGTIGFVTAVDAAIAAGELGDVNGELAALIGHPTAPIADILRQAS
jgi:NAD(P)H dehydrogenase (quinone)